MRRFNKNFTQSDHFKIAYIANYLHKYINYTKNKTHQSCNITYKSTNFTNSGRYFLILVHIFHELKQPYYYSLKLRIMLLISNDNNQTVAPDTDFQQDVYGVC